MNEFTAAIARMCIADYPKEKFFHLKGHIQTKYWNVLLGEIGDLFWTRGMRLAQRIVKIQPDDFDSECFADLLNESLRHYFYAYWLPAHPERHISEITEESVQALKTHQLEMAL